MKNLTKQEIIKMNEKCENNFEFDIQYYYTTEEKTLVKTVNIDENFSYEIRLRHEKISQDAFDVELVISKYKKLSDKTFQLVSDFNRFKLNKISKKKFIKTLQESTKLLNDEALNNYINKCNFSEEFPTMSLLDMIEEISEEKTEEIENITFNELKKDIEQDTSILKLDNPSEEITEAKAEAESNIDSPRLENLINQFKNTKMVEVIENFCQLKNLVIKDNKNYTMIYKREKNKKRDKMLSEIQFKKKSIRFFINEKHLTEDVKNLSDTEKSSIGEFSYEFPYDVFDNMNQSKILELILNDFKNIIEE